MKAALAERIQPAGTMCEASGAIQRPSAARCSLAVALKRCLALGVACVAVMAAAAMVPRGGARFDGFDLIAAVSVAALGMFACARLRGWDAVTSVGYVLAVGLLAVETADRLTGYPDKELLWPADLLWVPLLGVLIYRRQGRVLAVLAAAVATTWLTFAGRQLAYLRPGLDQPSRRLAITAVAKVRQGRLWAFGCIDDSPVVAVYTPPSAEPEVHILLDGRGSMDAQRPNVPLPFRWRVRCPAAGSSARRN